MPHAFLSPFFLDQLIAAEGLGAQVHSYLARSYPDSVLGWVDDAHWAKASVPLSQIKMGRRPGGRNMDKVEGIAKSIKQGNAMDPVVLVKTGPGQYAIADGYHRTLGFQRAGMKHIEAWVGSGVGESGPWDEEMHAAKLNVKHGEKAAEPVS